MEPPLEGAAAASPGAAGTCHTPAPKPCDKHDGSALRVASLNLGGRSTNPVEFEFKGDSSEMAVEAMRILRKAGKVLKSAEQGPLLMPASELELVEEILAEVFGEESESYSWVRSLLRCETWNKLLSLVKANNMHLFNTFNLYTLKLSRPSVWESPASCREFTNTLEYLIAWKQWYSGLDRKGTFWLDDAPRVAKKRNMAVPEAFAGLLIFDLMCLCTARGAITSGGDDDNITGEGRDVPFKELASFASRLPSSSLAARQAVATKVIEGAHALLAQEARCFADNPTVAEEFLPPFSAIDGFTAVFLRKDSFTTAVDISAAVAKKMEAMMESEGVPELSQRAWRTTASRLAAVSCECHRQLGGFRVCFVSLHASKSDSTASFLVALRGVLADYDADINVVGMDANCSGTEASAFPRRLCSAGFEVGCTAKQEQVTVAKERTAFQTQIQKVGDLDVSHKDYIVSWGSLGVRRAATTYKPDLRTPYGVEQETRRCMRLPTTQWPFDHCAVMTSFKRRSGCRDNMRFTKFPAWKLLVGLLMLLLCVAPFASGDRESFLGPPGGWIYVKWTATPFVGICEAAAPCSEGWLQDGGSCYLATPKLMYSDFQVFCEGLKAWPVSIGSEEENELIVRSLCPRRSFCLIGLRASYSGERYWVSGGAFEYSRILPGQEVSANPLTKESRIGDYQPTILANFPAEVSGCDWQYPSSSAWGGDQLVLTFALPAVALAVSAVLLLLPRPKGQRMAFSVLFLSFLIHVCVFVGYLFPACFASDYATRALVRNLQVTVEAVGQTLTSVLALTAIVRRMCMLYTARALKAVFWALILSMIPLFFVALTFVDLSAPVRLSVPVIVLVLLQVWVIVLYLVVSVMVSSDLHQTWALLHREATNGCNESGTTVVQALRSARLHFLAVVFATLTGAARWSVLFLSLLNMIFWHSRWTAFLYAYVTILDAMTNEFCVHVMAVLDMDKAILRAKGISAEAAERADKEVQQHRLAVHMLRAAPTSREQLRQLSTLEVKARAALGTAQEKSAFLILQSAVRVEATRIHSLMHCVRVRAMTMRMRYQYLADALPLEEEQPRQYVPERFFEGGKTELAAASYFDWLYSEAEGAQQVLFRQVKQLLGKFNGVSWPSELGLLQKEFPWRVWTNRGSGAMKRLPQGEVMRPGDILIHCPAGKTCCLRQSSAPCIVLEETSSGHVIIHRSGTEQPEEVPHRELRTCDGGAVFVPGPQKKKQRCFDKINIDYEGAVPWPAAASVVDICRCMVTCDDPYALATFVSYLRSSMKVVRLKNRFNDDMLESCSPGELQSLFYAASNDSAASETNTLSSMTRGTNHYRDISINVEVRSPSGVPVVCEIQVTLTSLAILKRAEQKLYTVRRMKEPSELRLTRVFAEELAQVVGQVACI